MWPLLWYLFMSFTFLPDGIIPIIEIFLYHVFMFALSLFSVFVICNLNIESNALHLLPFLYHVSAKRYEEKFNKLLIPEKTITQTSNFRNFQTPHTKYEAH